MMSKTNEIIQGLGLTNETYLKLLDDCKKKVHGYSDLSWEQICQKYDLGFSPESLRKAAQLPLLGGIFVNDYIAENAVDNVPASDITEISANLELAKVKYRDARNAFMNEIRKEARVAENLDILSQKLDSIRDNFFMHEFCDTGTFNHNREMIVCLSDMHIGLEYCSRTGSYDTNIAKERLSAYLDKVCEIGRMNDVDIVRVVCLGDQISGNIHKTVQLQNRENVIDQIQIATEYITSFVRSICRLFPCVHFYCVSGNHTRLDKKEDAIHDERLDNLVGWMVSRLCDDLDNFISETNAQLDSGVAEFDIQGNSVLAVHGDFDFTTPSGVAKTVDYLGYKPNIILRGHMHSPSYSEISNVSVIQSGALCGSGDQYTVEKRLIGKPSQTILIVDADGIDSIHNISL